jgi:hypothetical protein
MPKMLLGLLTNVQLLMIMGIGGYLITEDFSRYHKGNLL